MDYCSSCRRTLNGALVCPGCGAYAPDIAPPSHRHPDSATTIAPLIGAEAAFGPETAGFHADTEAFVAETAGFRKETAGFRADAYEEASPEKAADDPETPGTSGYEHTARGAQASPACRAAGRRQLALRKKKRRRAAVVSAVALVGGGLTIAALPDGPSGGPARAASAPDPEPSSTTGVASGDPAAAQPDARVSRDQDKADRPRTGTPLKTTPPTPTATQTTSRPQRTVVSAQPSATGYPQPRTTPATSSNDSAAQQDDTAPPQATATTPAPAEDTSTASPSSPAATSPTSPVHVCLLGLCVG